MKRLLLPVMCLSLVWAACGSGDDAKESIAAGDAAAMVNDHAISVDDVKKVAGNFRRQQLQPDEDAKGESYEERLYYTAVDRLVEQALVVQDAEKHGISVTPEEVESSVTQLKAMAGGDEGLQKVLTENDVTLEEVRKDMEVNLLIRHYFEEVVVPSIPVSDEEIQVYYEDNAEQFAAKPEVRARHILIRRPQGGDEMAVAETRQRAQAVLLKVKQGEDFAALAREYSEDETTAGTGGDLSWFGQGRMVAPFDSASFALSSGEVSGLVETQFGYHIIKVEERRTTEAQSLDDAREGITGTIRQTKSSEEFPRIVAELREQGKVEIRPPSEETLAALAS